MSISATAMSLSLFHHHIRIRSPCSISSRAPRTSFPPRLLCSAAASGSGEREESRWLREEQRWLREEQRWLREEQRWITERESLLREISILRLRIQQLEPELERRSSLSDSLSQIASRLETTISLPSPQSDPLALSSSSSSSTPFPPAVEEHDTTVKEGSVDEDFAREEKKASKPPAKTLKVGSEGDEVKELQEALLKLGFYSGEEEMEFSAFSSGTQRAVKTWQSSIGAPEDGIMTVELLKKLYAPQQTDESVPSDVPNGATLASVTENTEIQQPAVKKEGKTDAYISDHRVFLLGENRWEEPSRLTKTDKHAGTTKTQASSTRCLTCRGEGRLLCTECDGTGEPNIEPQFVEWVEEGTSCPYCEGQGYIACDTCDVKPAV